MEDMIARSMLGEDMILQQLKRVRNTSESEAQRGHTRVENVAK
jgi:hypothetical protein